MKTSEKILSITISSAILFIFLILLLIIILGESGKSEMIHLSKVGKVAEATTSFEYGLKFLEQDNYDGAIFNIKKAIKLDPDFSQAYTNLAIAYAKKGENKKAIKNFHLALETIPKEKYLVYHNMAQVFKRFDKEKAKEYYLKAIETNPNPIDIYFDYGQFLWHEKQKQEAIKYFKKGIEYYELPKFYIGAIQRGLQMYKDHPNVITSFSKIDIDKIDDETMKNFDTIVFDNYYKLNNPKLAKIQDQIGYYYYTTRDFEQAKFYFEASVKVWNSPKNRALKNLKMINSIKKIPQE